MKYMGIEAINKSMPLKNYQKRATTKSCNWRCLVDHMHPPTEILQPIDYEKNMNHGDLKVATNEHHDHPNDKELVINSSNAMERKEETYNLGSPSGITEIGKGEPLPSLSTKIQGVVTEEGVSIKSLGGTTKPKDLRLQLAKIEQIISSRPVIQHENMNRIPFQFHELGNWISQMRDILDSEELEDLNEWRKKIETEIEKAEEIYENIHRNLLKMNNQKNGKESIQFQSVTTKRFKTVKNVFIDCGRIFQDVGKDEYLPMMKMVVAHILLYWKLSVESREEKNIMVEVDDDATTASSISEDFQFHEVNQNNSGNNETKSTDKPNNEVLEKVSEICIQDNVLDISGKSCDFNTQDGEKGVCKSDEKSKEQKFEEVNEESKEKKIDPENEGNNLESLKIHEQHSGDDIGIPKCKEGNPDIGNFSDPENPKNCEDKSKSPAMQVEVLDITWENKDMELAKNQTPLEANNKLNKDTLREGVEGNGEKQFNIAIGDGTNNEAEGTLPVGQNENASSSSSFKTPLGDFSFQFLVESQLCELLCIILKDHLKPPNNEWSVICQISPGSDIRILVDSFEAQKEMEPKRKCYEFFCKCLKEKKMAKMIEELLAIEPSFLEGSFYAEGAIFLDAKIVRLFDLMHFLDQRGWLEEKAEIDEECD